jgi:hypothetical protein
VLTKKCQLRSVVGGAGRISGQDQQQRAVALLYVIKLVPIVSEVWHLRIVLQLPVR